MRINQTGTPRLYDLAVNVRDGRLQPAAFQRPYRWTRDDVLAMCESVVLGYPLGGFLTWIPKPDVQLRVGRARLGPIVAAGGDRPNGLLLDGQNRLATAAWMMRAPGAALPHDMSPEEAAVWDAGDVLALDLAAEVIRFVPAAEAEAGFFLPSSVLFRNTETMDLVRKRWDTTWADRSHDECNAALRFMDRSIDAFSDARVTETVLEYATPEEAKKAFAHICRVGVPMSADDFSAAICWSLA